MLPWLQLSETKQNQRSSCVSLLEPKQQSILSTFKSDRFIVAEAFVNYGLLQQMHLTKWVAVHRSLCLSKICELLQNNPESYSPPPPFVNLLSLNSRMFSIYRWASLPVEPASTDLPYYGCHRITPCRSLAETGTLFQ